MIKQKIEKKLYVLYKRYIYQMFFFLHVLGQKRGDWVHSGLTSEGASDFNELPCGIYKLLLFCFSFGRSAQSIFHYPSYNNGSVLFSEIRIIVGKKYISLFSPLFSTRIHLSNVFSDRPQKNFEHFSRAPVDEQKKMFQGNFCVSVLFFTGRSYF